MEKPRWIASSLRMRFLFWADFDAYDDWADGPAAGAHFNATLGPLLEDMANSISQDGPISRFPDAPNYEPTLINVTEFYLIPGKQQGFPNGSPRRIPKPPRFPWAHLRSTSDSVPPIEGPGRERG
jgi:hypothetical protein